MIQRVVKGLCVRGELETEQTATYWPPVPLTIAALLFSFCWAAQQGVLSVSNSNSNFNCNLLQLTQLSVAPGYIFSCERRICAEFNPSTVKVISWYLRLDTPVSRLTAGSKVNMLQHFKKTWAYFHSQLNDFKYFYPVQIILFTFPHLFAQLNYYKCCFVTVTI